jgi:hypothetical protein
MELFVDWRYELSVQMTPFCFEILIGFLLLILLIVNMFCMISEELVNT